MKLWGGLSISLWLSTAGVIVLYVFFIVLSPVSPAQVAGVSGLVFLASGLIAVRSLRLSAELTDPGGDPLLRQAHNRQRERRGF